MQDFKRVGLGRIYLKKDSKSGSTQNVIDKPYFNSILGCAVRVQNWVKLIRIGPQGQEFGSRSGWSDSFGRTTLEIWNIQM